LGPEQKARRRYRAGITAGRYWILRNKVPQIFEEQCTMKRKAFIAVSSISAVALLTAAICPLAAQRTSVQPPPPAATSPSLYLAALKSRLQKQTGYAFSQHNNAALWARLRQTAVDALEVDWRAGKLQGSNAAQAYYVKCDRSTMTQSDIDMGRVVILVGVAPVKPAEFVTLRIIQWTADHHK
jgi:hypothetical protein